MTIEDKFNEIFPNVKRMKVKMPKMENNEITDKEIRFLSESNKIEEVYDEDSLNQAIESWLFLRKQKELTIDIILKTHKILMLHQSLQPDQKGYFRKQRVWVGWKEGLDWMLIPEAIYHWCQNVMDLLDNGNKENKIFIENIIKEHHVRFEEIHGFVDGNGRLGRLLMYWEYLKAGLPILFIKKKDRQTYYQWWNKLGY